MTIGVFIAQLDDAYQRDVWRGISARARECGHGLIGFIGQRLNAPEATEAARNFAYHLAGPQTIDGLIVIASTFGTFHGIASVQALVAGLDLPTVSVGIAIPGTLGLTVNGGPAMAGLMRHLIHDHGCRRIALIAGPRGHREADERESSFRAELAAAGLGFDEGLLARGNFMVDSGAAAARQLLGSGRRFEALVCLNDRMAMGAMSVVRDSGLRIPEDVLVTGFDDIWEARWESPPLTTVVQPLEAMGSRAVDLMLELLAGKSPEPCQLDCRLVVRQSCSCPPRRRFGQSEAAANPLQAPAVEPSTVDRLRELADAGAAAAFLALLNARLLQDQISEQGAVEHNAGQLERWHGVVQSLARGNPSAGGLFQEAHDLISAVEIRQQAAARILAQEQHQLMRSLSAGLAGSFSMDSLIRQLSRGLERLGIGHGFLAVFAAAFPPGQASPGQARLLMAAREGRAGPVPGGPSPEGFDSHLLLPTEFRGLFAAGIWVLEPLVFQDEALGYLIMSGENRDPSVYDNLRDQVSSTLKGSLLMDRINGHKQELEREVVRRTQELILANQDLTAGIAQRRILEREIQEISDRTMQAIGQDLHDDLCQHLAGITMFTALLEAELRRGRTAAVDTVVRIRSMLEESIIRTRQIARGLYPPGLEERGLVAVLEDLVDGLRQAGRTAIELQVETDLSGIAATQALQVFRIIQESIANSLRHSGSDRVTVRIASDRNFAVVTVRDYGCGLGGRPDQAASRGMGLNIMRCRAESIGAELVIETLDRGLCVSCRLALPEGEQHG